jgi:hypothetical protein
VDFDVAKNTVHMLMGRGEELSLQTITLAKDQKIKVQFDERTVAEISVAQLTKPLNATVVMSEDKKSVKSVTVSAPTMRVSISSVDMTAKKVNVIEGRQTKALALDANAVIRSGAAVIQAERVVQGSNAILGLSLDRERVLGIVIVPPTRRDGER